MSKPRDPRTMTRAEVDAAYQAELDLIDRHNKADPCAMAASMARNEARRWLDHAIDVCIKD